MKRYLNRNIFQAVSFVVSDRVSTHANLTTRAYRARKTVNCVEYHAVKKIMRVIQVVCPVVKMGERSMDKHISPYVTCYNNRTLADSSFCAS